MSENVEAREVVLAGDSTIPEAMALIQRAVDNNVNVETIHRLMDLHERMQAKEAKRLFDESMARFQAACPTLAKRKAVGRDGQVRYRYSPLEDVAEDIAFLCESCGFTYRFDTDLTENKVAVRCYITHRAGHTEVSTVTLPAGAPQGSGKSLMNAQQAMVSAISYGKRTALAAGFGLRFRDEDDDGYSAGTALVTEEQAADLQALAEEAGANRERFLAYMGLDGALVRSGEQGFGDIPAAKYQQAVAALEAKRAKA